MIRIGIDATPLPEYPAGAGTYIIQLIRALTNLENQARFVIFAQKNQQTMIGCPEIQNVTWISSPKMSPIQRLLWEQISLPILLLRNKVDVFHSLHYTRPILLPCASVVTFHDMTFFLYPKLHTRLKRILFPIAIRISAYLSDHIIAVSECTQQDAMRILNLNPLRISAIPNGISEDFRPITDNSLLEECRNLYHLPENFILFTGLIEPRKNLPALINAYALLVKEFSPPPLVIVGRSGWGNIQLSELINQQNLKDQIIFTGYISARDLPIVYNLAQVFVYPSLYEGFGFPPLEAMACGIPVVSSDSSAMREIIGEAGILVPARDINALADAIRSLLQDSSLRLYYSSLGKQRSKLYSWKRTAQETLRVYQQVTREI